MQINEFQIHLSNHKTQKKEREHTFLNFKKKAHSFDANDDWKTIMNCNLHMVKLVIQISFSAFLEKKLSEKKSICQEIHSQQTAGKIKERKETEKKILTFSCQTKKMALNLFEFLEQFMIDTFSITINLFETQRLNGVNLCDTTQA